jgi:hypothetical protein
MNFVDALTLELINMPDEQVLEGKDVAELQASAQALLKSARAEAGRRRLAAAKSGVAALRSKPTTSKVPVLNVSVAEARQFIAQAQNDSRYTLAARKLGEMPDEEVLRLYLQMKRLEDTGNGACEMVSTEDLEALTRPGDVSWACTIDRVVRERDELLTALGDCRDAMPDTTANINEAIAFPTSVPAYVRESVSLLVAQRDELLAVLKAILADGLHCDVVPHLHEKARAAIAKAEGGAA